MFFYRMHEITDEKERQNLRTQEVGDEYQKGIALTVLGGILMFAGLMMLVGHAINEHYSLYVVNNNVRMGGKYRV